MASIEPSTTSKNCNMTIKHQFSSTHNMEKFFIVCVREKKSMEIWHFAAFYYVATSGHRYCISKLPSNCFVLSLFPSSFILLFISCVCSFLLFDRPWRLWFYFEYTEKVAVKAVIATNKNNKVWVCCVCTWKAKQNYKSFCKSQQIKVNKSCEADRSEPIDKWKHQINSILFGVMASEPTKRNQWKAQTLT